MKSARKTHISTRKETNPGGAPPNDKFMSKDTMERIILQLYSQIVYANKRSYILFEKNNMLNVGNALDGKYTTWYGLYFWGKPEGNI